MVFITIESDNENIFSVLRKDPLTSPHLCNMRSGILIGFKLDHTKKYVIRFVDLNGKTSFRAYDRYDSDISSGSDTYHPQILSSTLEKAFEELVFIDDDNDDDNDIVTNCSITQSVMYLSNDALKIINKINEYLSGIDITIDLEQIITNGNIYRNCFEFKVHGNCKMQTLLQLAFIVSLIISSLTFGNSADEIIKLKIIKLRMNKTIPKYIHYIIDLCFGKEASTSDT